MQGITPEMARAELARRQSMAQGQPAGTGGISREMAQAELARRQNVARETPTMEGVGGYGARQPMSPFMGGVSAFNSGVEKVAHGALQPILESGVLGERVKKGSEKLAARREEEMRNALLAAPTGAPLAEMAGGIVGSSPTWAIGGVGKNALLRAMTAGGIQGAITGGAQYVPGNDAGTRGLNALEGGAFGAAAYPAAKALSAANPYVKAVTGGAIGSGIAMARGVDPTENPLQEGAYIAGGALAPFVPGMAKNALMNGVNKAKSALTGVPYKAARTPVQNMVAQDMLAQVNPEEAMARKAAAERLGLPYITPAEASGSPIAGAAQGNVGKTTEGGQMLHEKGQQRLASEKTAIKDLFNDVYPKAEKLADKEKELYGIADQKMISPNELNILTKDPVINDALEKIVKTPAFAKDLEGVPYNSLKYLNYAKKYISDRANDLRGTNEARLLKDSEKKLVSIMDEVSPEYKQGREIAARRLTRQDMEKALNDKDIRGTNFYNKLLKNDKKFDELRNKVSNIPGAQQKLDDMRLVFQDLINPATARTAAGLSKTKMVNARSTKEAVVDKIKELTGGKYDKAAVNLITSPKWDEEFAEIAKMKSKEKRNTSLLNLLARASSNVASQKIAEMNQ